MTQLSNLLFWTLIIVFGLPIVILILGEIVERLEKRSNRLGSFVRQITITVLPTVVLYILLRQVFEIAAESIWVKIGETMVWLTAAFAALRLLNILSADSQPNETGWRLNIPAIYQGLMRAFIVVGVALYLLAGLWQVPVNSMFTALGVGSLVVALALQDTLSNLVSGLLLLIERPFQISDWISIDDREGEVIDINWRAVRLMTRNRDILIIPNNVLASGLIENFTIIDPLHAEFVDIGFSYDDPPNKVRQILYRTTIETVGVEPMPQPIVQTLNFNDFSIDYRIKFYVKEYRSIPTILSTLRTRLYYVANRHNLTIPYPISHEYQYQPEEKPQSEAAISEILHLLPYFTRFDEPTIQLIAAKSKLLDFGEGEQIIVEGQNTTGLYVVLLGRIVLSAQGSYQQSVRIAEITSGEMFGEMALLFNQRCLVTATTLEDVEVLWIPTDTLRGIVQENPQFSAEMNQHIENRREQVTEQLIYRLSANGVSDGLHSR